MNQKTPITILAILVIVLTGTTVYFATTKNATAPSAPAVMPQAATPSASPTPATPPQNIIYKNAAYGFTMTFPQTWKDYTAKTRTLDWDPNGTSDSIDFGFAAQDSLFNVSIHTKSQWQKIKAEGGATPTYLGENTNYVFAYNTAQFAANAAMTARMKEINAIIKTFHD